MPAARSFAITMAVAIAVTQSPARGFTIRERHTTSKPISDLTGEASSLLEVKYDIERKDVKPIKDLRTEVIAVNKTGQNANDSNETRYNVESTNNTNNSNLIALTTDIDKYTDIETTQIIPAINETTINTRIPLNISDENGVDNLVTTEVNIADYSETSEINEMNLTTNTLSGSTQSIDTYTTQNEVSSSNSATTNYKKEIDTVNSGMTSTEMNTISEDTSPYTGLPQSTIHITTPSWKKYTIIDRKRATTTTETLNVLEKENMVKSETAQTRITVENVINMTPIPSPTDLRQNLTSIIDNHTPPAIRDVANDMTGGYSSDASSSSTQRGPETSSTKIGIVSSKRGGYLHNTETTTPRAMEKTTVQMEKVNTSHTETFSAVYETEASDMDAPENKNVSHAESRSQLVEDAINEELLKEETILDNEENAQRYNDEVKSLGEQRNNEDSQVTKVVLTDDAHLSVKPITNDKKINASLYAVNPNYKPLKKIDVQPLKQFVRDPDDNSWRNESISSLGIVFKPKNASKSFKEVLKNKTETELSNASDKDSKNEVPDLKVRLEKIAEVRKMKKKKTNKFGEVVYTDYDSSETSNPPTNGTASPTTSFLDSLFAITTSESENITSPEPNVLLNTVKKEKVDIFNIKDPSLLTTTKPKKFFNIAEYYDTTDEYDADYLKVTKIDLKKFTKPIRIKEKVTTPIPAAVYTTQLSNYLPERRPTVQYFPPTKKVTQKVNLGDYDTDFQRKLNIYAYKDGPKNVLPVSYGTVSPSLTETEPTRVTKPQFTPVYKPESVDKNLYLTHPPGVTESQDGYALNDGNFNRASYVIKHYKDFINEAVKEIDEDRNIDYIPFTESPVRGVTINELAKLTEKDTKPNEEEYDYDLQFRKDLINRFVDNFNQNSDRFKVDFPILYNNSVIHKKIQTDNGRALASSTAYLRRQYEAANARGSFMPDRKPCEPSCDKLNVDLTPDYELHYYIPEQEEKEVMENRQMTVPYRYRNTHL